MQITKILNKPIKELKMSIDFKRRCVEMGFNTLQEIADIEPRDLIAKKGFNYVWLAELSDFLMGHDLLHVLQPTQGNSGI